MLVKNMEYVKAMFEERDKAVRTALAATDKRLDILNELRGNVATDTELKALEKRIDLLESSKKATTNLGAFVVGAFGILSVIIAVIVLVVK